MNEPINPYDSPEPSRAKMSGTTKVLLGVGILASVMLVLCCGGFGVFSYWAYSLAKNAMSTEPAVIAKRTDEILTITIPDSLPPKMSMDMPIPFAQGAFQMVYYGSPNDENGLALVQFTSEAIAKDPNARLQFNQSMNSQFHAEDIETVSSEPFETRVNDEPATFTIVQGKHKESSEEFWVVTGNFKGKLGPAELLFHARTADFTQEQVLDLLKSMK